MKDSISDVVTLHNGVEMPRLGLGTYKTPDGAVVENAVLEALDAGYRHIDTASFYNNENGIGRALRASGVPREQVFVTTKIWNDEQGRDSTGGALQRSLDRMGLDYVDLYLIHWPVRETFVETWRAMEGLYSAGTARAIGVSNFLVHHLLELMNAGDIVPMVNQFELHPLLVQQELIDFCRSKSIQVESWAPLSRGKLFDHPLIREISAACGKKPSQILVRWGLQHGFVVIPKSARPDRVRENAAVFDFYLPGEDMARIDGINRHERLGPHPDTFTF